MDNCVISFMEKQGFYTFISHEDLCYNKFFQGLYVNISTYQYSHRIFGVELDLKFQLILNINDFSFLNPSVCVNLIKSLK